MGKYKKIFGILGLLVVVTSFTAFMAPDSFLKSANIENTLRWTALFGIISVGVAFVIMTGGIDLSIGSVVCLVGCVLAMSLETTYVPIGNLKVSGVDDSQRALTTDGDVTGYQSGDRLRFLDEFYFVESASDSSIIVTNEVATAGEGSVVRVFDARNLTGESDEVVRRGMTKMRLRTLTLAGEIAEVSAGDRITIIPQVGLTQDFFIHSVERNGDTTDLQFYVLENKRVREPAGVSIALRSQRFPTPVAILLALFVALGIGLVHGLLITKVKLQPFVVTLCGLLIYRGVARYATGDQEQGFASEYAGLKQFAKGDFLQLLTGQEYVFDIPMPFVFLVGLGGVAAIFLNKTIFGRYILALGRNEEAALYSGIQTEKMVIASYMICSLCAGLAAILFALDLNSIQPSGHGSFYELYAIAAAVLGGCSLRGGEGSILGVVIAAAVMRVLNNAINLIDGIDTTLEFAIIGMVILMGVIVDETVRRVAARRNLANS
ncbi:MAG: ABC transporter permease [Planctomycetota bacterium]|nr:ABC transporter permease [Planctomycetota bacterium]